MSTYRFDLQHTGRPFGPCEVIPDWAWKRLSRHTTLSAAYKAEDRARGDMHEATGPAAWSDHFRVVPLRDTVLQRTYVCLGTIRHDPSPDCVISTEVAIPWPAGEPMDFPVTPDYWDSHYQCAACAAIDDMAREREDGIYDK